MTFQERLELFPPVLCRLLARTDSPVRPLSLNEIMGTASSGTLRQPLKEFHPVAVVMYQRILRMTDWLEVPMIEGLHFMRGCGVDLTNGRAMVRHDDYLKKNPTFNYLRNDKDWNSYYHPLLVTWRKSYPVDPPADLWPPIRNLLIRLTPIIKPT